MNRVNAGKILLTFLALAIAISAVVYLFRLMNVKILYDQGETEYQSGRCQEAVAAFDRLIADWQPYDLNDWKEQAISHRQECVAFLQAGSWIEQYEFGKALIAYQGIISLHGQSDLRQKINETLLEIYDVFGVNMVADDEICGLLNSFYATNLIPDQNDLRPLFQLSCAQWYDGTNQVQNAFQFYQELLIAYPQHALSYEAELALLNNADSCKQISTFQSIPKIAARKDFLPMLYWGCGQQSRLKADFAASRAYFDRLQQNYASHPLTAQVPNALKEIQADMEKLQNIVDQSVNSRNKLILVSVGVSFIPGIGDVKDILDFLSGRDLITGDKLTREERYLILATTILASGSAARYSDEMVDMARYSDELNEVRQAAKIHDFPKYCDEMSEWFARHRDELYDLAKYNNEMASFLARFGDDAAYLSRHGDELLSIVARNQDEAPEVLKISRLQGNCSFSAQTVVSTPSGLRPIANIIPGDMVYAYNQQTGKVGIYPVISVIHGTDDQTTLLQLENEILETTPEHPFFTTGQGWVPAGQLKAGDQIITREGEKDARIISVETLQNSLVSYNLTVQEASTFYVGYTQVLVHNICNSTRLNKNLNGVKEDKMDAHHLIPGELEQKHKAIELGEKGGWDMNASYNGVHLPQDEKQAARYLKKEGQKLPIHTGGHPEWNAKVQKKLDDLWQEAQVKKWGPSEMKNALTRLDKKLQKDIYKFDGVLP